MSDDADKVSAEVLSFGDFTKKALRGRGNDGDDGSMPPDLDKRVAALEGKVDQVRVDLAEIKGRLSNMPTTFQLVSWFVGVAIGLTALVFTIARAVK